MDIEILGYQKIQAHADEEPFWSVRVQVEGLFEVSFPVPFEVPEKGIPNYISEHKEDVFRDCKSIYSPRIAHQHNIVDMFLDIRELKKRAPL